jgi:hypothetical protein
LGMNNNAMNSNKNRIRSMTTNLYKWIWIQRIGKYGNE